MAASRVLFTIVQLLQLLIAVGFIIASVVTLTGTAFQGISKLLPSDSILFVFVGLGGATLVVSAIGLFAVVRSNLLAFKIQFALSVLLVIVNLLFIIYLLLFVNDVPTFPELDNLADLAFGRNSDDTARLALEDPQFFSEYQNSTNCCGVSLEALYNNTLNGVNVTRFDSQITGARCVGAVGDLFSFVSANPFQGQTTLNDFASALPDLANGFFCGDIFFELIKEYSGIIAGGFGVLVLFQVIGLVCSILIICYVPTDNGALEFENAMDLNKAVLRFSTRPMTLLPTSLKSSSESRTSGSFTSKVRDAVGSLTRVSSYFGKSSNSSGFVPGRRSFEAYGEPTTPPTARIRKGAPPPLPPRSEFDDDDDDSVPQLDDDEF